MTFSDWVASVGTLGLLVTAFLTWRAASAAATAARSSQSLLFVELAPVVEITHVSFTPGVTRSPEVVVTLKNVGRSAAVNGYVQIEFPGIPKLAPLAAFDLLGPGVEEKTVGVVNAEYTAAVDAQSDTEFRTTVAYDDLAGNHYEIVRIAHTRMVHVSVEMRRQLQDGSWSTLIGSNSP